MSNSSNLSKLGTIIALPGARYTVEAVRTAGGPRRRRATLIPFFAGLALLMTVVLLVGSQARQAAEIERLPVGAQTTLYQQTLREVRSICAQPAATDGVLREHCLAQAHFVTLFPECDPACRLSAGIISPHAHR
jgi:hypothetical protein